MAVNALTLALFALSVAGAAPDELAARARAAEASLDYDAAADLWLEVIAHPDTDDALRFEANLSAGSIERIRGNDTEARFHFQYVLRKNPDHRLAETTPPKVRNFFELVRQEVKAELERAPAPPKPGAAPIAAPPPAPPDDDGVRVLPLALGGGGIALAAIGAVAVIAGAVFGVLAQQTATDAASSTAQVERRDLNEQAQQHALVANIAYGAAAIAVVAGLATAGAGAVAWSIE